MFIACGISGERVAAVIRRLLPFVLVEYACALVFAYVPWFSTFLPSLMAYLMMCLGAKTYESYGS